MKSRISLGMAALCLTACNVELPGSIGAPIKTTAVAEVAPDDCVARSWVAGTTEYCHGQFIYRDYIYDDHGATNPTYDDVGKLSSAAGSQKYPAGAENTADLVELRLWIEGDQLKVRALLNTLYTNQSTQLGVAIDTDNNAQTGGGSWSPLDTSSNGWEIFRVFGGGDPETNVIEGSMPIPEGRQWRVQAALAQADGTVMNVAYRGPDEGARGLYGLPLGTGVWFEDKQAAALMNGDISEFGALIDVASLRSGDSKAVEIVGPGLHERVYTSDYTLPPGEGTSCVAGRGDGSSVTLGFEQEFCFLGKYQPYGIYIPNQPQPHGVQMAFHGSGANHASAINGVGFQKSFGETNNRLLVTPLARGPDGYGSDISERDLLDVMDDVERNYPVDLDRVFAGGYSQGGYITFRMAALYPQRFAGLVSWVGFPGDLFNTPAGQVLPVQYTAGGVGNDMDLISNLRYIPGALIYALEDELVPFTIQVPLQQAFEKKGTDYEYFLHLSAEHLTFILLDSWDKEAAYTKDLVRVKNPPHVTYRTADFLGNAGLGIYHDQAYWVSAIRGRSGDPRMWQDVDLRSYGCGQPEPQFESGQGNGTAPVPWVSTYIRKIGEQETQAENRLEGSLSNIGSLRIDVKGSCLKAKTQYRIVSDGPAVIEFSDGRVLQLAEGNNEGVI